MRTSSGGTDDSGVPTLDQLISEQKSLRGYSYADLETRAKGVIRRQRWQQLGTGVRIKEFPEPATIEAMATALDVDVAVVVLAAARSIGLDVKRGAQSDLAARLPYSANRLSDVQRDAIVTLVRSITEVTDVLPTDSSTPAGAPSSEATHQKIDTAAGSGGFAAEAARVLEDEGPPEEPRQSDYDLANRRGKGKTKGEMLRDRDMTLGEGADPEGPEGGA